ncbi:MAG: 50S ribosomal protein L21 [Eggerthellaceae bacterium]|nr:50S ribosomal protein L21 [Eggerthellaceae bacterium]
MYAIVKTGGKQYKVAAGDIIEIEKLDAEVGDKVQLDVICVVDGGNVEADPEKAAGTTVTAEVLDQFKGEKQLVFKFKKRKNYKRTKGHRQQLTRVRIDSIGAQKAAAKKDEPKKAEKAEEAPAKEAEPVEALDAVQEVEQKAEDAANETAATAEETAEEVQEAKAGDAEAAEEATEE